MLTWGSEPKVPACEWRPRMASETTAAEQEAKAAGRECGGRHASAKRPQYQNDSSR